MQTVVVGRRASHDLLGRGRAELRQQPIGNAIGRGAINVIAQLRRFDLERNRAPGSTTGELVSLVELAGPGMKVAPALSMGRA